jgi:hypothetical protein
MKTGEKKKLLAILGLPLALRVFNLSTGAFSVIALNSCQQLMLPPQTQTQPKFSSIFDCKISGNVPPEIISQIIGAYNAIWQSNRRLIQNLGIRGFKKLPIRIDYDSADSGNTIKYVPSSSSIQICGSINANDFAKLLENSLEGYLKDLPAHGWERIMLARNKFATAFDEAAKQNTRN